MGMDLKAFEKAQFKPREGQLTFPALQPFFPDGEPPVFTVRGLTATELAQVEDEAGKGQLVSDLVEQLMEAHGGKDKAAALLASAGINTKDTPQALKKRLGHVQRGLVEPQMALDQVVKLAESFPIEFTQLANKVMELTGKGQVAKVKRQPSGNKSKSEQP